MAPITFEIAEEQQWKLWDFGWLNVTRFEVRGAGVADDVLTIATAWFRDPISRRSFCSRGPWGEEIGRHGPWLIDRFESGWLIPVSVGDLKRRVEAALRLEGWEGEPVLPTDDQMRAVDAWLEGVERRGDDVLAPEAPPEAAWEWAKIWDVFAEFLCVARDQRSMTVAVIGYD